MKNQELAARMKRYESGYADQRLLPQIPLCARMDGRAFHSFTVDLRRPFDSRLTQLMVDTTRELVRQTNALIGYTQSDEISLVWYNAEYDAETFFDGRVLKMTSILAALTTAVFQRQLPQLLPEKSSLLPLFDARVWNVPTLTEAANYLLWREIDATRNSISMAAQSQYQHGELHGKSAAQMHEMLFQRGINWNDYPDSFKRGTYVSRRVVERPYRAAERATLPPRHHARLNPDLVVRRSEVVPLPLPPLRRIDNREGVLFRGEQPTARQTPSQEGTVGLSE